MKTLNQIRNTFWGLEQEICWDWLYEQQEGNIYGKTSENFMYFNMFFLNFLFRIIIFYLIDYMSRSMNEKYCINCTWEYKFHIIYRHIYTTLSVQFIDVGTFTVAVVLGIFVFGKYFMHTIALAYFHCFHRFFYQFCDAILFISNFSQ